MAENFLLLDSMGNYSAVPDSMAKQESVREPRACGAKMKREGSETRNSRFDLFNPDHCDTTPEVIVKVEAEEEPCLWGSEMNGDREIPPATSTGFYVPGRRPHRDVPHRTGHREGAPVQERERQRNVKFSEEENDILIKKISENYEKILGKLTTRTSTSEKKVIWRDIAACVNSVSAYSRTTMQCKKRYADIKKKVKEKMAKQSRHQSGTGSGTRGAVSFWPYEKYLMSIISCEPVLGLQRMTEPGHVNNEGGIVSHLRPCWRDIGNSSGSAQTLPASEDQMEEECLEMAEDSVLGGGEKVMTLSDVTPEFEDDSQESDNIQILQGGTPPLVTTTPQSTVCDHSTPHREHMLFERSVHKKLNHLSACIKTQTSVLRQTNTILQNLSSNVQNGFQQLVNVIQQAITVMSPGYQSSPQPTSQITATTTTDTRVHNVSSRGSHGRRGLPIRGRVSRGHCPYITSPPAKKSRGRP